MDLSSYSSVLAPSGILSGAATLWYYGRKILKEIKKSKEESSSKILEEAKQFDKEIKEKLEARIDLLENQLHNLEENVSKDLSHIKETQASEIKNLASKIDELREELRTGHSSLIQLLTRLVDKS